MITEAGGLGEFTITYHHRLMLRNILCWLIAALLIKGNKPHEIKSLNEGRETQGFSCHINLCPIKFPVKFPNLLWCNQTLESENYSFIGVLLPQPFVHCTTEILQLDIYQNCAKGAKELKPRCMLRMGS